MSVMTMRDSRILELFANGGSPQSVADVLGVTPEYAFTRVKELLAQDDIFDTIEKRKLLIYQLKSLYSRASDMLDSIASDKSWAQGVAAITKLIETTYNIQIKEEAQSTEEIEAATKAQAYVIIKAVEMAYDRARTLLLEENPRLEIEAIDAAFQQGLSDALVSV